MLRKFLYGSQKLPEWYERFQEWNGKQSSTSIPYRSSRMVFTEKYIRIVINNILTELFKISVLFHYLSTNHDTSIVSIAQTFHVLHDNRYIAICSQTRSQKFAMGGLFAEPPALENFAFFCKITSF